MKKIIQVTYKNYSMTNPSSKLTFLVIFLGKYEGKVLCRIFCKFCKLQQIFYSRSIFKDIPFVHFEAKVWETSITIDSSPCINECGINSALMSANGTFDFLLASTKLGIAL